ncbi:MAG: GatB/YqeY domain-containing protein [Deltaproteobacteria bacterium]|nr:GatB/YqeY domain-containing protein [Deltaproteobacteria bacterium]
MSIRERILEDIKVAMRAKDELARDTLRMLRSDLGKQELTLDRELSEDDVMGVLVRAVKTRTDSAAQYDEGGRPELAEKERLEIEIVRRYLPKALDEDEAKAAVAQAIRELDASSKKDMGRVMKALRERHGARLDGKLASRLVSASLS